MDGAVQAVQPEAGQVDSAELCGSDLPGSFEYALNEIVEEHLDLSMFERRYRNDDTGRLAYDPKVLLKIVLYGYYKGLVSSRKVEEACRRNVVFMALSADTRPHFTTIAAFVASWSRRSWSCSAMCCCTAMSWD